MFDMYVNQHRDNMISTLQALLRIPSVKSNPEPGHPFGAAVHEALEYVLNLAREHGFQTKNVDGFAGHVEFGEGDEYVAVLSHLDVVPEGTGWTQPPFDANIVDGRVFARGAIDDKGPAMSALWALIALKECGLRPKRKIRLIFGLDEESDWQCMEHYFQKQPLPLGGFTPDADFPMIFAEKGVCSMGLEVRADEFSMCPQVIFFDGGHRDNMVPDYASAKIDCHSETAAQEWEQKIRREAKQRQMDVLIEIKSSIVELVVRGVSAHGSTPEKGKNAITLIASLLSSQPVSNASMWRFIASQDIYGKGLGIEDSDDVTGALTVNLGRGTLELGMYTWVFNIRYPVHGTSEAIAERCRAFLSDKWSLRVVHDLKPLYVPLDSPVIQTLKNVYESIVGEDAAPMSIGGATYARAIPNAVAFGPMFPHEVDCAHQADESWSLESYFQCIQIYAHAMYELANTL